MFSMRLCFLTFYVTNEVLFSFNYISKNLFYSLGTFEAVQVTSYEVQWYTER